MGDDVNREQPAPAPADGPAIWDLVIQDMQARDRLGESRYGTRLRAGNGRDALRDAYEEALDLCVYLRQVIEERRAERDALARLGAWLAASNCRRCWVEASNRVVGRQVVQLEDVNSEGPAVVACGYPEPACRPNGLPLAAWLYLDTTDVSVLLAAALDEWERTRKDGGA